MVLVTKPVGNRELGSRPVRSCGGGIKMDLVEMNVRVQEWDLFVSG
jgi:hypothetical protein